MLAIEMKQSKSWPKPNHLRPDKDCVLMLQIHVSEFIKYSCKE